jgi:RND family efflux transporter MFP subunit
MKRLTAVLTTAAAACLAGACSTVEGTEARPVLGVEAREAKAATPVKAEEVALAAPEGAIRYSAAIEAFAEVPLAFKSAGYVDDVLRRSGADGRMRIVQAGDAVARGTVLARVRETEYRQRVSQGRARLSEAEAGLEKARRDLDRARLLFASESLTRPDLDAAQAAFDAGRARVDAATADLELATTSLHDTALVAPASGILLERRVETGSLAGTGTVAFVLGDVSAVKARFGIPDAMLASLTPGERIDLVVEALAGTGFEGRVTKIAPAADPQSRVFDVEVTIPNPDGRLRPGMIGSVAVGARRAGVAAEVPTLPLTAIVRSTGGAGDYAAFVVERRGDADVARLRPVQLGEVIGNAVAVTGGISPGERVIVTGASLLVDGETVRLIP